MIRHGLCEIAVPSTNITVGTILTATCRFDRDKVISPSSAKVEIVYPEGFPRYALNVIGSQPVQWTDDQLVFFLTSYTPGRISAPAMDVIVRGPGTEANELARFSTEPLELTVVSVLPKEQTQPVEPFPIVPTWLPAPPPQLIGAIVASAAFFFALVIVVLRARSRRRAFSQWVRDSSIGGNENEKFLRALREIRKTAQKQKQSPVEIRKRLQTLICEWASLRLQMDLRQDRIKKVFRLILKTLNPVTDFHWRHYDDFVRLQNQLMAELLTSVENSRPDAVEEQLKLTQVWFSEWLRCEIEFPSRNGLPERRG